jgi:hypothetical protein
VGGAIPAFQNEVTVKSIIIAIAFFHVFGLQIPVNAQRLKDIEVYASEAYASTGGSAEATDANASMFWSVNLTPPRWVVKPATTIYNVVQGTDPSGQPTLEQVVPEGVPKYSLNYEYVTSMMSGVFSGAEDVTIDNQTVVNTWVPSILVLHNGHASDQQSGNNGDRVFQIFSIEARGYRTVDPSDQRVLNGTLMKDDNIEGLGISRDAQGDAIVSKYNVLVDRARTDHPTLLRYSTNDLNVENVKAISCGGFYGDIRDEVVFVYDDGTQTLLYTLDNTAALTAINPLDYTFTRNLRATWTYQTLDSRQIVASTVGDRNGDGKEELWLALYDDANDVHKIVVIEHNGTTFVNAVLYQTDPPVLDFSSLKRMVSADIDNDGDDELVMLTNSGNSITLRYMNTDGIEWTLGAQTLSFPAEDACMELPIGPVGQQISVLGQLTAGDVDAIAGDEVLFIAARSVLGEMKATRVYSVKLVNGTWTYSTIAEYSATVIAANNIKYACIDNMDYDIRHRADLVMMYMDPNTTRHEDRLLVCKSMPAHSNNDYAVDGLNANNVAAPLFAHGWYGLRLVNGQSIQGVNYRDEYADPNGFMTWMGTDINTRRGFQYHPDAGSITQAELDAYSAIYNTIIAERRDMTDEWYYELTPPRWATVDALSTLCYYNAGEMQTAMQAYLDRARAANLNVIPYLSFKEHDNYDLSPGATTRSFLYHDFSATIDNTPAATSLLPEYFRRLLDPMPNIGPSIVNHPALLGWLLCDEPSSMLTDSWHTQFAVPALAQATALNLSQRLRDQYSTVRARTDASRSMVMNYHMYGDFEYYRNSYDVAMFDYYPYVPKYNIVYEEVNGVRTRDVDNNFIIADRTLSATDDVAAAVQYSFNRMNRRLIETTIRCDKRAAFTVLQGHGDTYIGWDREIVQNGAPNTLRAYRAYRNQTLPEARYQLFSSAVLGIRGVFYWTAATWMQGSNTTPEFNTRSTLTNRFQQPVHYESSNMTTAAQQRAVLDAASAEFSHYRSVFLTEALYGRVTTSEMLPGRGVIDQDISTSLHHDQATSTYWLFVVNLSSRTIISPELTLRVSNMPSNATVWLIPHEYWQNSRAISVASVRDDLPPIPFTVYSV